MEEYMTDEQFKTYNQLLELVEEMLEELPDDKKTNLNKRKMTY
jgi:hypothetical protein